MPRQILSAARDQAERSDSPVKAAALLHIARVLTAFDQPEAERVLEQAITLASELSEEDRDIILGEAVSLAACVSPQRAFRLVPHVVDQSAGGILLKAMVDMLNHGHVAEAVTYLSERMPGAAYPFGAVGQAMAHCKDDETRLQVFRGAIRAMRDAARADSPPGGRFEAASEFLRLFTRSWTVLPADEAAGVVRELVRSIVSEPDQRTTATFSSGSNTVRFSSRHERQLFEILNPLQRLAPDLTQSLVRDHPQLAAAVARFPYGMESMHPPLPAEADRASREPVEQPDYIDVGRRLIPIPEAISTDFKEAFDLALHLYAVDSDAESRNDAPRACWPSTQEFRKILFKAGQHEGHAAARHLDRIPNADLRLFAQIELAAALAGLPQLGGSAISLRRDPRDRMPPRASAGAAFVPPPHRTPAIAPPRKPNLPASYDLRISPTARKRGEGPSGGCGSDYWTIEGVHLKAVLSKLYEVPESRIDLHPSLDSDARYDFFLVLPRDESQETMRRLMQEGIEKHFHVSVTRQIRPKDVYVLTAPNGITAREAREDLMGGFGSIDYRTPAQDDPQHVPDSIRLMEIMNMHMATPNKPRTPEEAMRNATREMREFFTASLGSGRGSAWINGISAPLTMEQLCQTLEGGLTRPVVDETNLKGTYAVDVHSEAASTMDFLHVLRERLGLVAMPGRRDVAMLVVRHH